MVIGDWKGESHCWPGRKAGDIKKQATGRQS